MPDLLDLIGLHVADLLLAGARPNTIRAKRHVLRMLSRGADRDLIDLQRSDLVRFLTRPGLSRSTQAIYLVHLRTFYRWAVEEGHLEHDPTEKMRGPKPKRGVPRPMPVEDLMRAVAGASPNIRTWLLLGAFGGLRCCEMAVLQGEDIHRDAEVPMMIVNGKGGRIGTVPLHPLLLEELAGRPRRGWLFPHRNREGDHVLPGSISTTVNHYLHRIGIDSTLHATRHLFGTSAYRLSGFDLRMTQELLRHASPVTTSIYTKVDPVASADIVSRLSYSGLAPAKALLPTPRPAAD